MRVFIIGSKELSCSILDAALEQGHEVAGVYVRDDQEGMMVWHQMGHRNLAEEAKKRAIPVHYGMNVNSSKSLELLESLNLDLILSCFWNEIFKEPILNLAKRGAFNFHTALLPKNRGSRPLPWALIKGESHAGMTVHKMMTGVDNGPIIAQKKFPITPTDTGERLYEKATQAGISLATEVLQIISNDEYKLLLQDEEQATYQPRGEPYGRQIDPYWNEERKGRFIRAFDFPPFEGALQPPAAAMNGEASVYLMPNMNISSAERSAIEQLLSFLNSELKWTIFSGLDILHENERVLNAFDSYPLGPAKEDLIVSQRKTAASRFVIHQLKQLIKNTGDVQGIRPDVITSEGVHSSYRVLDLLMRNDVLFTASRVVPLMNDHDLVPLQPHRHLNGLLEIPSLSIDCKLDGWEELLNNCLDKAKQLSHSYKRDVFVGACIAPGDLNTFLNSNLIKELFEAPKTGFVTYGEVCRHYNSIYTNK